MLGFHNCLSIFSLNQIIIQDVYKLYEFTRVLCKSIYYNHKLFFVRRQVYSSENKYSMLSQKSEIIFGVVSAYCSLFNWVLNDKV